MEITSTKEEMKLKVLCIQIRVPDNLQPRTLKNAGLVAIFL